PLRLPQLAPLSGRAVAVRGRRIWWRCPGSRSACRMALGRPGAAGLASIVILLGCGQAVFRPALQSLLPMLVAETKILPAANALFDATERIARLLGPGLVGALGSTAGQPADQRKEQGAERLARQ